MHVIKLERLMYTLRIKVPVSGTVETFYLNLTLQNQLNNLLSQFCNGLFFM